MSNANVIDSILSIIPVAATVAVAGSVLTSLSRPIKKGKDHMRWL